MLRCTNASRGCESGGGSEGAAPARAGGTHAGRLPGTGVGCFFELRVAAVSFKQEAAER